jgi:hypothetical protein
MKIQERLKDLIVSKDKLNISQMKFSLSLGKGQSWASMIINRNYDISAGDILKMEEVFGINPMYILKGEEPVFLGKDIKK